MKNTHVKWNTLLTHESLNSLSFIPRNRIIAPQQTLNWMLTASIGTFIVALLTIIQMWKQPKVYHTVCNGILIE